MSTNVGTNAGRGVINSVSPAVASSDARRCPVDGSAITGAVTGTAIPNCIFIPLNGVYSAGKAVARQTPDLVLTGVTLKAFNDAVAGLQCA